VPPEPPEPEPAPAPAPEPAPKPAPEPERPGRILARLARQVELAAGTVDISLAQYRLLILLSEGKEAASALADKLAVTRPSVTGVVDGLVARGLVERDHDVDDRRRVGHALTAEGRRVLATADAEVERRLDDIVAHRPEGAAAAFAGLAPWQQALDAHRATRRAERARQAETARAERRADTVARAKPPDHAKTAPQPPATPEPAAS
jgi:long-chain acyl-CoA synthetase